MEDRVDKGANTRKDSQLFLEILESRDGRRLLTSQRVENLIGNGIIPPQRPGRGIVREYEMAIKLNSLSPQFIVKVRHYS